MRLAAVERWLEVERERIALWVPVALGCGIAAWFALPDAAAWAGWIAACLSLALVALRLPAGGRVQMMVVTGALLAVAGCIVVWGKALAWGEPPIARARFGEVAGLITAVEQLPAQGRVRVLVEPDAALSLPRRIRVNIEDKDVPTGLREGARVRFRARLMPPPPPAVPGAYDFAQRAFFMGLGATGRALPPIRVTAPADGPDPIRQRLSRHVQAQLPAGPAGIAAALATGDRGAIAEDDAEAMRRSGLAHLLSISGLHVSALIGTVILLTWRTLALSPRLALTLPLLTIAAGVGALAGISYTLLTGAEVPTVRSCVAALLVLGGLALGRDAITLRLVGAGVVVVLLFWPESLVGPSFQMSFAAVAVIVATVETPVWKRHLRAREEAMWRRAARALLGLFVTGLAVEFALMPIALAHFHQAGVLGAVANLVAIPLTTFVVMPAEAVALLLDVAGAGAPAWWIVGKALTLLLALAHHVAASPFAVVAMPRFPMSLLGVMALGGLWLLIWSTRIRLLGLLPMLAAGAAMAASPTPDVLVTGDGRHLAVRTADGRLALLRDRAGDYVRDTLGETAGIGGSGDGAAPMPALEDQPNARCSIDLCAIVMPGREKDWTVLATRTGVRLPWRALIEACAKADIVVSDRTLPGACAPRWLKLDRARLSQTGGVSIHLDEKRWDAVRDPSDRHPWIDGG